MNNKPQTQEHSPLNVGDESETIPPLDWLDAQREALKNGLKPTRTIGSLNRTGRRYAEAIEKFERAESDLARAFNRWNKLRLALRRYEREMRALQEQAEHE